MSAENAADATEELPERVVRSRNKRATTLHRLDEDAEEPLPACPEGDRDGCDWTDVPSAAYRTYEPCRNPECFGGDWR